MGDGHLTGIASDAVTDGPAKILIVDDDDLFRESLVRILTGAGYECHQAVSGEDARARLDSEAGLAAALCDIQMPGETASGSAPTAT